MQELFARADKCEQGILRLKRIQFERRRKDPAIREWDERSVEVAQLDREVVRVRREADEAEARFGELEKTLTRLRSQGGKLLSKRQGMEDIRGISEDTTALLGLIMREQMADPLAAQWIECERIHNTHHCFFFVRGVGIPF